MSSPRPALMASLIFLMSGVIGSSARAQFNVPLPPPQPATVVLRDEMQYLFADRVGDAQRDERWEVRVQRLRERAISATKSKGEADSLAADAGRFCAEEVGIERTVCTDALSPDNLIKRFGTERQRARTPHETYIRPSLPLGTPRPQVSRYLRFSAGNPNFSVIPQFAANISDEEAYVVTSLVRGLIGRGIFSADQAIVVARSGDPDPAKRDAIENDKANALRAVNNGGTLVARYTMPMYAASGATASGALGLSLSTGVIGPIADTDGPESARNFVGSGAFEALTSFPIRGFGATNEILADFVLGSRAGYTRSGGSLRSSGGSEGVGFFQLMLGLRQNGVLSASALVTFATNGFNDLVPRLGLNLAARR